MAGFIDLRRNVRDDMAIAQNIGGNIGYALGARSAYKQQQEQQQIAKERKQTIEQGLIRVMADPSLTPRQRREEAMKIPNIVDTKIGQNIMMQQVSEPKTETEGQLVTRYNSLLNAADKAANPEDQQFIKEQLAETRQKIDELRNPPQKNELQTLHDEYYKATKSGDKKKADKIREIISQRLSAQTQTPSMTNPSAPVPTGTQQGQKPAGNKADREIEDLLPESDHDKTMRNWTSQMGLDMFTPGEKVTTPNGTEIGNYDQAGKIILNDTGLQWLVSYGKANKLTKEQTLQFAKENNWIVK